MNSIPNQTPKIPKSFEEHLCSPVSSSLLFGFVFFAAIIIKLIKSFSAPFFDYDGLLSVLGLGLGFAVVAGIATSMARRLVPGWTFRKRNFVTGSVAGLIYSGSCLFFFGSGMDFKAGLILGAFVLIGFGWAIGSALNEFESVAD